ncbi:MAG: hypothetical protein AAB227_00805, partial [Pseudomonadota bacterium]
LGREYAQALIGAGLYDELLTEITKRGLFAGDDLSSSLFRAEASFRQGRFDEAILAANAKDNPYLAFARARAVYAMTADRSAVSADLATALRGPKALAGEAWLFRARLALDANDFDSADAAALRAAEAGIGPSRTEFVAIEKSVRTGDLETAARMLAAREKRRRGAVDPEDYRLAAMIRLRTGDAAAAVRLIDRARGADGNERTRLVAALAKHLAGDKAQAWSLATSTLSAAPKDWAALDLAAAIARDMGRKDDADALLTRLASLRPALATIRKSREGSVTPDAAFEALTAAEGDLSAVGVAAFLLGPGLDLRGVEEARDDERALADAADAIRTGEAPRLRASAARMLKDPSSPVGLALAGVAFTRLGDTHKAVRALTLSAAAAPDFLAPVLLQANLLSGDDAAALLREVLMRHADNSRARLALATLEAKGGDMLAAAEDYATLPPEMVFSDEQSSALYGAAAKNAGGEALKAMLHAARVSAATPRLQGIALAAAGDAEGAAAALRRAVLASPEDADTVRRYVEAITALGRDEEAASLILEIGRRREAGSSRLDRPAGDAEGPENRRFRG